MRSCFKGGGTFFEPGPWSRYVWVWLWLLFWAWVLAVP